MAIPHSIKNRAIPFALFMTIIFSSCFLVFYYKLPYRLYNSDIYHQLAVIKEFNNKDLKDPYFAEGPVDLHAGPYYYLIYLYSVFAGVTVYTALMVFVAVNTLLIALSLYYFGKSFNLTKNQCYMFIIISLLGWGNFQFFFAGIYEFSNFLVTGSFPASIGFCLLLILLGLAKRYENH